MLDKLKCLRKMVVELWATMIVVEVQAALLLYIYAYYNVLCLQIQNVTGVRLKGPFLKYVALFFTNVDPPPVTLCHIFRNPLEYVTHIGPLKVRHTLELGNPDDCPF